MEYKYIPDSYHYDLINRKFGNLDLFVKLQVLYREGLEALLRSVVDFDKMNKLIRDSNVLIPRINDYATNFYHNYSTIGSDYVFLRNNFHLENLSMEELTELQAGQPLGLEFYRQTAERVLFEEGDVTFFGIPTDETRVHSKSLVFEFAYDQTRCVGLEQVRQIDRVIQSVFDYLETEITRTVGLAVSFLVYKAIPNLYPQESDRSFV